MHVKVANKQVVEMSLTMTLHGAWTALVQVDAEDAITGATSLLIADLMTFSGTVDPTRSGAFLGRAKLRLVAGANGLDVAVTGKTYYRAPLRVILGDILLVGGEALSDLSDAVLMATAPKHWARARGTVREELDVLAGRFGFEWRHLPDGKVWVGTETWDASAIADYQLLSDEREDGMVEIAAEVPAVLPGETFLERQVSEVEHSMGKGGMRTTVRFVA